MASSVIWIVVVYVIAFLVGGVVAFIISHSLAIAITSAVLHDAMVYIFLSIWDYVRNSARKNKQQ